MMILYEDAALVVCVKPRGVLAAADASGKRNMADLLAPRRVFPVHRLDADTLGVMVFAKTQQAAAALSKAMQDGSCKKEYLALCDCAPAPPSAVLEDLLFYDRTRNKTYVVNRDRRGVKTAKLSYRTLCTLPDGGAWLHIRLYTGRTQQIRAQLAQRKCPLRGDRKYGAKTAGALQLYAWRLTLPGGKSHTLPREYLPPDFACKIGDSAL
ncbi:MAG: RluA family pseudouridine synthase [Oscillospiraceae bacterium]|nr:RluA family pseudouridine synthase [Oscillospiraceae bacterium]